MPGRIVASGSMTTSASIQVVAGSMTVTPSFIQRVTMRRLSSWPSSASWARSLAPSVCVDVLDEVRADGEAVLAGEVRRCR